MKNSKYHEVFMYLVFGGATTAVNWGSYSLAVKIIGGSIFLSNIVSWVLATLFAFITNKLWVFESKDWDKFIFPKEFLLFCSGRGITGVFEIAAVPLLVKMGLNQSFFGIDGIISKISVSVFVVILNYFISKFFIFKN